MDDIQIIINDDLIIFEVENVPGNNITVDNAIVEGSPNPPTGDAVFKIITPDVTPQPITHAITIDLSKPFQTSQAILTGSTEFSPITGTAIESYVHRKLIDLNGVTPTFNGFTLWDENAVPDTVAGQINIVVFFKMGPVYYYNWFSSYTGVLDDNDPPQLSSVSISEIAQIVAQINATSDEGSTLYWGVYANGATAPTYAQLVAGTGSVSHDSTSLTANVSGNDQLTGLTYSTAYDVYYSAIDGSGNHTDPVLIEFTTIARVQVGTPTVTPTQLDADTARFSWSNQTGNNGYAYRYKINSGSYGAYQNLAANTTSVDIDATAGQTIYFQVYGIGNLTTTVDGNVSTEVSQLLSVNQAPVASNVVITGTTGLGDTLTGDYDYSDNESNAEGTSTFRWLRNDVAISGEIGLTHVIVLADQGTTLKFEVIPVASTGTSPGTAVASSGTSIPANQAPSYSTVSISGTAQVGQTLTGSESGFYDPDSDSAGTPDRQWVYSDAVGGTKTAITGATNTTYVIDAAYEGKYIYYGVRATAATGTSPGSWQYSAASGQVQAAVTTSTPQTEAISNLQGLWVCEKSSDFTLSGTNVTSLKDRSTNGRHLSKVGSNYNTFDGTNKYITTSTSAQLQLSSVLQFGTGDFTIILYEALSPSVPLGILYSANADYNSHALLAVYSDLKYRTLGSTVSYGIYTDCYVINTGGSTNSLKKHIITKTGATVTWSINGSTPTLVGNHMSSSILFEFIGLQSYMGNFYALALFNKVLSAGEITIVTVELNTALGL